MNKLALNVVRAVAVGVCLSLSACVFLQSGSISESSGAGAPVNAEYSDYGFLHLTAPITITSNANTALAAKCQSGMLSGVQTELSMRDWFFVVQYYTVTAAAACK